MRRPARLSSFPSRLLSRAGVIVLALTCFPAQTVFAEDMDFRVNVSETGSYDTNPMMVIDGAKSLYGSSLTPSLLFKNKTPTIQIDTQASVTDNRFNQSDYNSTDLHGIASLTKKSQLWEVTLNGSGDYDTARTSELTTLGLDIGSVRHTGYSLGTGITYHFSPLDDASITTSFHNSAYNSPQLNDYRTISVIPSWSHSFTPLSQGFISVQTQQYRSLNAPKSRTDSIGPSVGWLTSLTPRLTVKVSGGAQASKQSGGLRPDQKWLWNYIFAGHVSYKGAQDITRLSAERTRQPYANGTESLLTTFALDETHKINPVLSVNFRASYQFATRDLKSSGDLDSIWDGSAGLVYAMTPEWDLTTSYQYRSETLVDISKKATQSLARLGFSFHPNFDE